MNNEEYLNSEAFKKNRAAAKKAIADYFNQHKFCPSCGGDKLATTYMGCILPSVQDGVVLNEDSFKDTNEAKCACGWSGIVHDLKGEEK